MLAADGCDAAAFHAAVLLVSLGAHRQELEELVQVLAIMMYALQQLFPRIIVQARQQHNLSGGRHCQAQCRCCCAEVVQETKCVIQKSAYSSKYSALTLAFHLMAPSGILIDFEAGLGDSS